MWLLWEVMKTDQPRSHSIRGVALLAAFLKNWLVSKVLEAATWRPSSAFAFLFLSIFNLDNCHLWPWVKYWVASTNGFCPTVVLGIRVWVG